MRRILILGVMLICIVGMAGCNAPDSESNGSETETFIQSAEESVENKNDTETDSAQTSENNEAEPAMELKKLGNLQYYLYTPSDPTEDMTLIIYLHGGTNKREDVTALLTTDGFPKYLYEGYYGDLRAYVAVPKLDNIYKGWIDIYDQIRDLIIYLQTNYSIDAEKVSLTGHSMGGTGTYQLQIKLPDTFACIAPMSGSIKKNETNIAALSKTKIWAFVGTEDKIVDPASSREIVQALKDEGASAQITELEGTDHFEIPSLVYKNDSLIQWLVNCGEG